MAGVHHALLGLTRNPLPIIATLPVIAGSARVNELLSVSTGSWFGKPTGFTYVWYRGAQSIATGNTYTPTTSDISARLTVQVTATNEFGSTTVETLPSDVVSPASTPTGNVILLESNDRLLQENDSFILLEEQVTGTGNFLLLESGDVILLESGGRLLLDQVEAPTDAYLDVSASYLLDVSGDYIREVP